MSTFHDDPLTDLFNAAGNVVAFAPRRETPVRPVITPPNYNEPCRKCGGSGNWRPGYPCFSCKGTGRKTFKTSREQRVRNATSAANRRANTEAENVTQWASTYPDVYAWMMDSPTFEFATSLLAAVGKYGDLTEKQMVTARKCMVASAARAKRQAAQAPTPTGPSLDVSAIEQALTRARNKTGKRPKLYIGEYRFQFASASSSNAGAIYVTNKAKTYLGKIMGGKFMAAYGTDSGVLVDLERIARDPRAAAIAHGFTTGNCACCGRLLTDPTSVANGIGPICAEGFGW